MAKRLAITNSNHVQCYNESTQTWTSLNIGKIVMIIEEDSNLPETYNSNRFASSKMARKGYTKILTDTGLFFIPSHKITKLEANISLQGKVFCLTGTLNYQREFFISLIETYDGKYKTSITKDVNVLICANPRSNSKKLINARNNGIKVISENEFWNYIKCRTEK